jgi:hypothetical protein
MVGFPSIKLILSSRFAVGTDCRESSEPIFGPSLGDVKAHPEVASEFAVTRATESGQDVSKLIGYFGPEDGGDGPGRSVAILPGFLHKRVA